jgi:hypothetical protein
VREKGGRRGRFGSLSRFPSFLPKLLADTVDCVLTIASSPKFPLLNTVFLLVIVL